MDKKRGVNDNKRNLTKTQQVNYQSEFRLADRAYSRKK